MPTEALAPSPSRAASIYSPQLVTRFTEIEAAFGGRDHAIATLASAPKTAELDYLLGLLTDHPDHAIADLCVAANLRPSDLLDHLTAGNMQQARALASVPMPAHLPQTVEDLMKRSHDYVDTCSACGGTKQDSAGAPCTACRGCGQLTYPADPAARDLALKLGGLTGKDSGLAVNVNVGIQNLVKTGVGGGALERVQMAADRVLEDVDYYRSEDVAVETPTAEAADVDSSV